MKHIPGTIIRVNKPVLGSIKQYFQQGNVYILMCIAPTYPLPTQDTPPIVNYDFECKGKKFTIKQDSTAKADAMIDYLMTLV